MSKIVHPYIPNSDSGMRKKLLDEIGIKDVEEIYAEIPDDLRFKGPLNLPKPFRDEYSLKKHVREILSKNTCCEDYINFLGGGTWQHHVPAVCDTINSRDEFLSSYAGGPYADHGKFQALFESASMIGDLVEMDIVSSMTTYDWANAASMSLRMASRITNRDEVLIPKIISHDRLSCIDNYCKPHIHINTIEYDSNSGLLDLIDLEQKISSKTAAVYFENPSYLGMIEIQGEKIAEIAHKNGAIVVVGVDPTSLGVIAPPIQYGADIVCGELQPLGMHMQWGGGLSGFIATRDEIEYVAEYPYILYGISPTIVKDEKLFDYVFFERTAYMQREKGKDYVGTSTALWGITAGVYLALMGPKGMAELGEGIMQRVSYAIKILSSIKNLSVPVFDSHCFKEFVINFDRTKQTVAEINQKLLNYGIFGGKDLSVEFPQLGQSALYCITEVHGKSDIDKLVCALTEILDS